MTTSIPRNSLRMSIWVVTLGLSFHQWTPVAKAEEQSTEPAKAAPVNYPQTTQMLSPKLALDPVQTGGSGDDKTLQLWNQMQREQEACNQCALRQPYPEDEQNPADTQIQ